MNKQKIIILVASILLLLTGCKDNNQEYRDIPSSLIKKTNAERMGKSRWSALLDVL